MQEMSNKEIIQSLLFGDEPEKSSASLSHFDYQSTCIKTLGRKILRLISSGRAIQVFCDSENSANQLINLYPYSSWQALFNFNGRISENIILDKVYNGQQHLVDTFASWEKSILEQGQLISKSILNNLSLKDIGDQLLFVQPKVKPHVLNLPELSALTDYYNEELHFIKQAQEKYSSRYSYLEFQNPFVKNIFHRFSYQELHEYLEIKLAALQDQLNNWEENDRNQQLSAVWKTREDRDTLWRLLIHIQSFIIAKKSTPDTLNSAQLNPELRDKILSEYSVAKDAPLTEIIRKIEQDLDRLNQQIEKEVWVQSPTAEKESLNNLYVFLDSFQLELKADQILRNFPIVKAAGLNFNLDILKQLIARLRAAIDFLENQKVYFEWLIFRSQLNQNRIDLLHYLEQQDNIWDDAFTELFLRNVFTQVRARLLPLDAFQKEFSNMFGDTQNAMINLLLQGVDNGIVKISLYDNAPDHYSNAYEYAFLNVVPDLGKLKGVEFSLSGWSSTFHTGLNNIKRDNADLAINVNPNISWSTILPIDISNHNDATKCALYLGQEIYNTQPQFKIYELKKLSIVSCLSPYKNLKLLESIGKENVKEILTDSTSGNLLPTILMPSDKVRLLLLENGLFDIELKTPLLHQLGLLHTIDAFDIQVENLYSYHTTQKQVEDLFSLAHRILEMNA